MTLSKLKIHPASHPDFLEFDQNYASLTCLQTGSEYHDYLLINTPFHLPNQPDNVFSQLDYFQAGGYLKHIEPYIADIQQGRTRLVFFFVDWWATCNRHETSGVLNGSLVSYDIYNWLYAQLRERDLLTHSVFATCTSLTDVDQYPDWPAVHFNEAFLRYLDCGQQIDTDVDSFSDFLFYLNRRPRAHRLYTLHELERTNMLEDCQYTFHFFDETLAANLTTRHEYLRGFLSDWLEPQQINTDITHLSRANFDTDQVYDADTDVQTLPELRELNRVSKQCYMELVTEYNCSNTKVFLTEKIARSIILKKPFVVVGDRGALAELRGYGFRTFNTVWDESYDQLPTAKARVDAVVKLLKNIKQTHSWHEPYTREIQEILDYNKRWYFQEFASAQQQEFTRIFQ